MSHFERKLQINKIIESQLPEFLVAEFPKAVDFFKQYYISQESQGAPDDLITNLDRYLKLDNLIPEVIIGKTTLSGDINSSDTTIAVSSTKGYPEEYGLLKIGNEIITYTSKTDTEFLGCIRGFSGIDGYTNNIEKDFSNVNKQTVNFSDTEAESHTQGDSVSNLSSLFLQEFYKKIKTAFAPGFENQTFVSDLDVANFIRQIKDFYQGKGIAESIRILFKVLYGVKADVLDLETRLIKTSGAEYIRREVVVAEIISGDPFELEGQAIYRSLDDSTIPIATASVSNVEVFTRDTKTYYKLELFVGFDDNSSFENAFIIPGFTKAVESAAVGADVVTVDSTIGFNSSGTIVSGNNTIKYTSKSINQFFGCSGITQAIDATDEVRSEVFVYGFGNGDIERRVNIRLTGVLNNFVEIDNVSLLEEGEEIRVLSSGENIRNPENNASYKEIFANSWIYNTSARYNVESIVGSTFTLTSEIDKSSLKVGDTVDVLIGSSETVSASGAVITGVNATLNQVVVSNLGSFTANPLLEYSIRRKLEKVTSSNVGLVLGNNKYFANVQNLYCDDDSTFGYVTSLSLPEYEIEDSLIESQLPDGSESNFDGYNSFNKTYSILKFPSTIPFIDGDRVRYTSDKPFVGLESGESYIVDYVAPNKLRLYISSSLLSSGADYLEFNANPDTSATHTFTLLSQKSRVIAPSPILRRYPLNRTITNSENSDRGTLHIGQLIDGVQILSPKGNDKIYYGPLTDFEVFNGGMNYDVINPPQLRVTTGAGSSALVEPIISGSVSEVLIDPQNFDVDGISAITLEGANGDGCILEPIIGDRFRILEFDSRALSLGGGIDSNDETVTFLKPHNLSQFQKITYNANGNTEIGIGDFQDPSNSLDNRLVSGDEYFVRIVNTSSIKLFNNFSDASAGVNTIGFTTATTESGIHQFRTIPRPTLKKVKVVESGSGYQHRKLRVKSSGISTQYNTLTFKNHGFNTGDIVEYSTEETTEGNQLITGLSTSVQYSIQKLDNDNFRLINVGVGATLTNDLTRSKYVEISGIGSGYHVFQYPPITVTATVSFGSTLTGTLNFTPIVTGPIVDAYMYESGTGYGSTVLNLQKQPIVSIKNGKLAQLNPIVSNGRIIEVQILGSGKEYFSTPELIVEDEGNIGSGAILRPVIVNGKIDDVIVINEGIGYDPNSTTIRVKPRGSGAIFNTKIRSLSVNDAERYAENSILQNNKIFGSLKENSSEDGLEYSVYGYSEDLANVFDDNLNTNHSKIIGWAFDGNPIYGPYGYTDADNIQSGVSLITPGYSADASSVFDRPSTSTFGEGYFIEDYKFGNHGDLDVHNGRFCKTPEFPNGTYAYFAGVTTSNVVNKLVPLYPYFVGNTFKSKLDESNLYLDQSFDFNNSNLVRNVFPYKVADENADYDFLDEGYETFPQRTFVTAVSKGSIEKINIFSSGKDYKVGDKVNFDETETGGSGLSVEVSELVGKDITTIDTDLDQYANSVFVRDSQFQVSAYFEHGFDVNNNENILVSGLTTSIANLKGSHRAGISSDTIGLAATMTSHTTNGGITEDIFIDQLADVSIGSTIVIHSDDGSTVTDETVRVLNNYGNGVIKVKRFGNTGVAHTLSSEVNLIPDRIKIQAKTPSFKSSRSKLVYFNANNAVGFGTTTNGAIEKTITIGGVDNLVQIPTRAIYVPNHGFKTGEELSFTMNDSPVTAADVLIVSNESDSVQFNLPENRATTATVYAINKGPNYIGLTTTVGLTTFTDGLYFRSGGSDNAEYLLKNNPTQVIGDVDRLITTVSTSSTHGLSNNDVIALDVKPNTIVGLGTTAAATVSYKESTKSLVINSVGINSDAINTATNTITLTNHGFETGEKVFYDSTEVASGLTTGVYYIIRDGRNTFRLAETLYETNPKTEKVINIVGTGASVHNIGKINPKIDVVENSDIKFLLGDPSLTGYEFKIFYDQNFENEFITSYDDTNFNVEKIGVAGVGTASLTLKYSENIPARLFYAVEKAGYISTADTDVRNYSEINYVKSEYNGTYNITGVTSTSFRISPYKLPSILKYDVERECDEASYRTKSNTARSGIGAVKILSSGFNYERLPKFVDVSSESGINANLVAVSTSIGKLTKFRIDNIGYAYPSDKTLRPEAALPSRLNIDNLDTISKFNIISGGLKYITPPNLLLWNDTSNFVVDDSSLLPVVPNTSIADIEQIAPIRGMESEPHRIVAINNSNGVGISSIISGSSGVATCTLKTPVLGFTTALFADGDEIFVEGIELLGTTGQGYNSENYNYRFFKVDSFVNSNPAKLTFSLVDESGVGLTTNPGIAKTNQSGYATIINKKNYPNIEVIQSRSSFELNEGLFVDSGSGFVETRAFVSLVRPDFIKTVGPQNFQTGDKIKGKLTGTIAEITSIGKDRAKFTLNYSSRQEFGWKDDKGKLSEDYQVTPDNDYYQNLSYSVKSPIPWSVMSGPVNSIVHPAGMKNFADVGITSSVDSAVGLAGSTKAVSVLDISSESRVWTINNFDVAVDDDVRTTSLGAEQSKFLRIGNRKLANYTECRTNRVLIHDDISGQFSSKGFQGESIEIEEIDTVDTNVRYLIQVVNPDTLDVQLSELVAQTTTLDSYLFEKNLAVSAGLSTNTNQKLGEFSLNVQNEIKTLVFTPTDPFDTDLDIKILKKKYSNSFAGIGTQTIGSIDLVNSNVLGISSVGTASSEKALYEIDSTDFNAAFVSFEMINRFDLGDFVNIEAFIDFDGTDTYLSEYYFDSNSLSYSSSNVGIITAVYDGVGIITVSVKNPGIETSTYDVRSSIIEFTQSGADDTYRFLRTGQPATSERSALFDCVSDTHTGITTIAEYNKSIISSVSSIVRVSVGSSSALHQVTALCDGSEVTVIPGVFVATTGSAGLGSFGGKIVGNDFFVNFYPDDSSVNYTTQSFNKVFYTSNDFDNVPNTLVYNSLEQDMFLSSFDSLNGSRANKTEFNLRHEGIPIYEKVFDPSDTNVLDPVTGIFTINNHFFNTAEELIYTPGSTFIGVGQTEVGIGETSNYLGVVVDQLPEKVYPIVTDANTFRLATTREFAESGIAVTFTNLGEGNAHKLEFTKKLSKTVIGLDGIVQQPITFTPVSHILENNGFHNVAGVGTIPVGLSTFNISGISSIQPRDLLKIDDEYMKVVEVGLSTNVAGELLGPINGIIQAGTAATFNTVSVVRASVGSTAAPHDDGATVQIYKGSFNIVGSKVHFTDPPKGSARTRRDDSNLPFVTSVFSGRTFLRSNYDTNMVFDDISNQFTGIGQTFTMKVGGADTTGIDIGNGILFLNGVFQTPTTTNNLGNNYKFENSSALGISSVVFSGITSENGSYIQSDFDINQNQLPRGGLIVSLGSTPGLGYAPLYGAKVKADLATVANVTGIITDIVGVNTYRKPVGITTADYDNITGVIEIETSSNHYLKGGERVQLVGLHFTCAQAHAGVTTTIFPDHDRSFDIVNILSANKLTVQVGPSTIVHNYVGFGSVFKHFSLSNGSGYRGPVSIGVTDLAFEHKFVRSVSDSIFVGSAGTDTFTATNAEYTSHTGKLLLTIPSHGLTVGNQIGIDTGGIIFTCSEDNFFTEQPYPRATDPVAGITTEVTSVTTNTITVNVGPGGGAGTGAEISATVGVGGTLIFSIDNGGSGYVNPRIQIPEPTYENMEVVGVSRLGVGATTTTGENLLMNVTIGAAGTNVGIGSTLFEVESFNIRRSGYAFQVGDVFKVVGLVTASHLSEPISDFELEVTETFNDSMSAWSFGEMNYIDSIEAFQDGSRQRFPLIYEGELLSFELDPNNALSNEIDLNAVLVIFVNGVLQQPGSSYTFEGGTSFIFDQAPSESDKVDIFFYLGQDGVDVVIVDVQETFKIGDELLVKKHPGFILTKDQNRDRTILDILSADKLETDIYLGPGINENDFKPLSWTKQKLDMFVKGDFVYKTRDSIEPRVLPTAKIIGDINGSTNQIFVDNAQFFNYEENNYAIAINSIEGLIVEGIDPVSAAITATVGASGTISALTINNVGSGYSGTTLDVKFTAPLDIGVGVGTTATATVSIVDGSIDSATITNIGFGYSVTNPPQAIVEIPKGKQESIENITNVEGFTGIVTGISTTAGSGDCGMALHIDYDRIDFANNSSATNSLVAGYPVYIYDTSVGHGVTTVDGNDNSTVGIGTTFLDAVYMVHAVSNNGNKGRITCNIHGDTNIVGIATTGVYFANNPDATISAGKLSWGRLYNAIDGITRTNPISIGVTGLTIDSGLSTFPAIQRRDFGFKSSGALRKTSNGPDASENSSGYPIL